MSDCTPPCRVFHCDDSRDSLSTASTSSEPLLYETNIPESSKRRIDLATAGKDRGTDDHILDALEFSWGMDRQTLNVDTRQNVFRLGSKFHALYDKETPMWLMLPEEHIIQQYYDAINNPNEFPDINEPTYKYHFLAHNKMVSVPIHRLTPSDSSADSPSTPAYTHFAHPYATFGPVISHVHPRFVICDVAMKMEKSIWALAFAVLCPNLVHALHKVVTIWKAWTTVADNPDFIAFRKKPYTGDNMSSTSKRTARRRLFQPVEKRRGDHNESPSRASNTSNCTPARRVSSVKKRRRDHNESPSRARKRFKEGRSEHDGIWLDGQTLREHDSKLSSKASWKRKKASISHWTKAVSETGRPVE